MSSPNFPAIPRVAWLVVVSGAAVLAAAIGVRHTFGLFLHPVTESMGWGREVFALAIAIQNLVWGMAQPFTGMLADRYGSGRVIATGGAAYVLGLLLMSRAASPLYLDLVTGLLLGLALSACSFSVVLGAVGRAVPESRRSLALGLASAGGSVGQLIMLPLGGYLLATGEWSDVLPMLALVVALTIPLAGVLAFGGMRTGGLAGRGFGVATSAAGIGRALDEVRRHPGYWLLTAGFFVCGFHITFIGTHLPSYISDHHLAPWLGPVALTMIGGFNIAGASFWGYMGGRYSKKRCLSVIYLLRAVIMTGLVLIPVHEISVMLFCAAMGFTWLGTVPLTSGLVGQIFGVRYLSTLVGIVFLSHQMGAFLGVWLGGWVYDTTGSYNPVWYIAIGLGVVSALLHWPINEAALVRPLAHENA